MRCKKYTSSVLENPGVVRNVYSVYLYPHVFTLWYLPTFLPSSYIKCIEEAMKYRIDLQPARKSMMTSGNVNC